MSEGIPLCNSSALENAGVAVSFDVLYQGRSCRAFAVRYNDRAHAYLNKCSHVPMEMDYQPDRFFDMTGHWLICATHGAMYQPETGVCLGGPCRGGLIKIKLEERDAVVHWHTAPNLKPVEF